jgi:hypothetical protein
MNLTVSTPGAEDTRLSQPVSITFTSGRLHAVIDEIAKLTGVDIRCGKDNKDWPVRDIPVIVCVKDMPLGKLLRLIADSTHLVFTVKHTEGSDKPMYRIYRDSKGKDDLYTEWNEKFKQIIWDWNALAALGKMPDLNKIKIEKSGHGSYGFNEKRRALARLVASLPPNIIDRILNGEIITLTTKTAPQPSVVADLYCAIGRYFFDPQQISEQINAAEKYGHGDSSYINDEREFLNELQSTRTTKPPSVDIDNATVTIKLMNSHDNMPQVMISIYPIVRSSPAIKNSRTFDWLDALSGGYSGPRYSPEPGEIPGLELPERPADSRLDPEFDIKGSKFPFVGFHARDVDWSLPIFKTKLHLNIPKDKKLCYGDVITALAEASSFNIVMENFKSHYDMDICSQKIKPTLSINADITLKDLFYELFKSGLNNLTAEWWSINPEEKVIMGWAYQWRKHHINLVPESLLIELGTKADSEGLDIDDVAPLFDLTHAQLEEWIESSSLFGQNIHFWDMAPYWRIYSRLTPKEKALAKSESGLPLAQIGIDKLSNYLNEFGRDRSSIFIYTKNDKHTLATLKFRNAMVSDTEFASTLTMRVYKTGTNNYKLEVKGKMDNEEVEISDYVGHTSFPIYSAKRKAELGIK